MYKYEMHIHSRPCSGGGADIEEHIRHLKEIGYAGMVITNHFINGDTRVDRTLPWEEFIEYYKQDYLRGKALADELDFDLLFGIEEAIGLGKEILIYGIDWDFLKAHPSLRPGDPFEYVRLVHEAGGLVYQAHPFRERGYISAPGPSEAVHLMDGIEVYNAGNTPDQNERALEYAKEKGYMCISGSDGHSTPTAGRAGIIAKQRIRTNKELVALLKSGDYQLIVSDDFPFTGSKYGV